MRFPKRLNPLISKAKSLSPLVFGDLEFPRCDGFRLTSPSANANQIIRAGGSHSEGPRYSPRQLFANAAIAASRVGSHTETATPIRARRRFQHYRRFG